MDSVTHLIAGAVTPLVFKHIPRRTAVLTFGMLAGSLPDMDFIYGSTTEALFTMHRGITHAIMWQPLWILIAVIPFYIWMQCKPVCVKPGCFEGGKKLEPFRPGCGNPGGYDLVTMYLTALVATLTHIYLDCMTTFGTMALLPFSGRRVEFSAMFIVDLLLTVPALVLCIKAWRQPPDFADASSAGCGPGRAVPLVSARARRIARIALAWVLLYPLTCLGINYASAALLEPRLTGEETPGTLQLITEPFSPFVWKAIIDEGATYRMGRVFLPSPPESGAGLDQFLKPEHMLYETLKAQHSIFVHFENFSPHMVQMERDADPIVQANYGTPVKEYSFVDLRYVPVRGGAAEMVGRNYPMFVLEARVNESGTLLAYRFLKRTIGEEEAWIELQ